MPRSPATQAAQTVMRLSGQAAGRLAGPVVRAVNVEAIAITAILLLTAVLSLALRRA